MKKRLLAILLSAAMLLGMLPSGAFAATEDESSTMTISVSEKTINYGEKSVTLPIEIKNNPGLVGATFYINFDNDAFEAAYDEDTELPDVTLGDGFGKLSIMPNESGKSPLKVVVYGNVNVKSDGTFVNVKFNVKDGAKPGKYTVSVKTDEVKGNKPDNKNETYDIEHETVNGSVTITGSEFNGKIKLSDDTVVYDGKAHGLEISGENLLPKNAEVKYFCKGEEFEGATEPGEYEITALLSAPGYTDKELDATLTIEKKTLEAELAVGTKVYDGKKSVTLTKKDITGVVDGDDVDCSVTAEAVSADAGKNIKVEVKFTLTGEDKDKYNPPKAPSLTTTVTARNITVTANGSKKLGEKDPVLEPEITEGALVYGDSFSGVPAREKGEKAGEYATKQGTLKLSSNYNLTFVPGTFEIFDKPEQTISASINKTDVVYGDGDEIFVTVDVDEDKSADDAKNNIVFSSSDEKVAEVDGNGRVTVVGAGKTTVKVTVDGGEDYADFEKSFSLTVAKRKITITAVDASKKIGQTDPTLTYNVSGTTADGDTLTVIVARKAGEKKGTYAIELTYTLSNKENYEVTVKNGTFTIDDKLTQTITVPEKLSLTYGDEPFDLEAKSSLDGAEIKYSVTAEDVVKYNENTGKFDIVGSGKTEITSSAAATDDYTAAEKKTTVTVAKAKLTVGVVSDKESYTYGDKIQADVSYEGFVYGETKDVLTKEAAVSEAGANAGTYKLKASGAAAANYEFEYETKEITINKAVIGLEKIAIYNLKLENAKKSKKLDIISYTLSGNIVKGDDVKVGVAAELKKSVTEAGTYYAKVTLTMSGADKANYELENGGKLGYDEDVYPVEVSENYGVGDILEQAIQSLYGNNDILTLSEKDDGIKLPDVPEGYKISVEDKYGEIDENGRRLNANVDGFLYVSFVVTETKDGGKTASVSKQIVLVPLKEFNVTVSAENGTVTGAGTYTAIDKITLEATPDNKYSFSHWEYEGKKISTAKKFTFMLDEVYDVDGDLALKAVFKKASAGGGGGGGGSSETKTYTVTFETNGADKIDSVKVEKNQKLAKPADPVREGFEFGGWFADEKLENAYDFDAKVTEGFTLYAKWTEIADENKDDENKDDGNKDDSNDNNENSDNNDDKKDEEEYKNPYTDVSDDDWFASDVEYVTKKGLFNGMTLTAFGPMETLTRGMIVTVLYRAEGEPENDGKSGFADVNENAYYAKAVTWARENGIVKGVSENEFAPMENVTREQIATILYNYAVYKGYDVSVAEDTNILSYEDIDEASEYAITALCYACGSGLIKGRTETTLNPAETATRAEAATIFARFFSMTE